MTNPPGITAASGGTPGITAASGDTSDSDTESLVVHRPMTRRKAIAIGCLSISAFQFIQFWYTILLIVLKIPPDEILNIITTTYTVTWLTFCCSCFVFLDYNT